MKSVVVLHGGSDLPDGLNDDLKRAGAHVSGATSCKTLVQDCIRLAADLVVAVEPAPSADFFAAAAVLSVAHPVAVAVFTDDIRVESMERALDSGIHAWVVRGYHADRLRAVLQLAQLRCAREQQQRVAYGQLSQRLEERKLVDRAKGILMSNVQIPESEAFRKLRDAAMQGKERVGQVAQRLISAASNAEAINRAGQLRMLSQRLVKLQLLAGFGVDPPGAAALRQLSMDRAAQNLDVLAGLLSRATFGDLLETTKAAWADLEHALTGESGTSGVQAVDAAAETLLAAAEQLTLALESVTPGARTQAINLSGRQRMLSQRYAKIALLCTAEGPSPSTGAAAELAFVATSFERALAALRESILTGARSRKILDEAGHSWSLLRNPDSPRPVDQRIVIAQASEQLLEHFDRLTEEYEHHIKVLLD